mmetsp:Transcript_2004/g.7479  ORF Transcript_2004/g.7479 Transcript_2004/m.7479 type:complete len:84 (+) Transcript_2004:16-267(+)
MSSPLVRRRTGAFQRTKPEARAQQNTRNARAARRGVLWITTDELTPRSTTHWGVSTHETRGTSATKYAQRTGGASRCPVDNNR